MNVLTDKPNQTKFPLRSADEIMRLQRMGAAHQCRLSFMRQLLRRFANQQWEYQRTAWNIDSNGVGHARYQVNTGERIYTLIAFSHDLPDEMRSDRVIAVAWDATFSLFDGVPTKDDIERLSKNIPLQEAGRISQSELTLSRANRSGRLFNYVVDQLANGQQPDIAEIEAVGYLMRTTAVYGSGKFGAADYLTIAQRSEFGVSFQAELLSVYLIRVFTIDIAEHLALVKGGERACRLEPSIKRLLGVGNSTGLGMAPFVVNHPHLLHNWISAREHALQRVRNQPSADSNEVRQFKQLIQRTSLNNHNWMTSHSLQANKIQQLNSDFIKVQNYVEQFNFAVEYPWNNLYEWAKSSLSLEGQEQFNMLLIEPFAVLVDELGESMTDTNTENDGIKTRIKPMIDSIEQHCQWAVSNQSCNRDQNNEFNYWYVSENKLEPRFGSHIDSDLAPLPLNIKQQINKFYHWLKSQYAEQGDILLATALLSAPHHRFIAKRLQFYSQSPYMEIRDNLVSRHTMPIDLLRLKLSFFGATKFDPRSDRWIRINMFQYAPHPDEITQSFDDDWIYPPLN